MNEFVNAANGIIWSPALIYLCLGVGLYFSIRGRFLQVRHFREMIRLMFDGKSSDAGVSSFQALAMTLAGRVGTGNIAGVATAITFGGPGAVFWMWMVAFLGASSAFVESTLGQIYKEKIDGQ
ncbi:alanine:cation symporter family protein, partial [Craterilacuibacter sp.]|uniref:alanine:cation symporter family protein n=1 Tax=Craterilacuibacter sp. TaxID=2870909 RepID=UPI003F34E92B